MVSVEWIGTATLLLDTGFCLVLMDTVFVISMRCSLNSFRTYKSGYSCAVVMDYFLMFESRIVGNSILSDGMYLFIPNLLQFVTL